MENFKINDENRLFIFPHEEIKDCEKLKNECLDFIRKSVTFDESSQLLVKKLGDLAMVVETQKLKALAEKSKLEHASERKLKKNQDLMGRINERKIFLENLQNEHNSLLKVEQEQIHTLEKIKNNKI